MDWYNGGMEHTTLHLLYSRFWHKFLYDIGVVPSAEPYQKRTAHGMILGLNHHSFVNLPADEQEKLLKDALDPNLVQTLENNPAIIHGGPFANIAHGCNSVMATKVVYN